MGIIPREVGYSNVQRTIAGAQYDGILEGEKLQQRGALANGQQVLEDAPRVDRGRCSG